ncbi:MAG: acetyl-CoA carboxylase, biotin carboxyl carrier protein, partial [Acidobacteria bacterium]
MNLKEIKELIEFLKEQDIAEFELERGDVKVRIKRAAEAHGSASQDTRFIAVQSPAVLGAEIAAAQASPAASGAAPSVPEPAAAPPEEGLHTVRSPIVGTFYEAPSPGAPPFVKAGDVVEAGQI